MNSNTMKPNNMDNFKINIPNQQYLARSSYVSINNPRERILFKCTGFVTGALDQHDSRFMNNMRVSDFSKANNTMTPLRRTLKCINALPSLDNGR